MQIFNDLLSRFILFFAQMGETFWEHLTLSQYSFWQTAVDILLVAMLFYWLIMLLKGTRAVHVLTGLFVLGSLYFISGQLNLLAVNWILSRAFPLILLAIPIIFHQEIRKGLERLGNTRLFGHQVVDTDRLISDIVETCTQLSRMHQGALIVFERDTKLKEYIETGQELDALTSKALLLSIFNPKSPLHDGAVILRDRRMLAAGCLLPNTFKEYDSKLGTRHKAAIGLSENSDAEVIVISEERKTISYVVEGKLEEVTAEQLQRRLEKLYKPKKEPKPVRRVRPVKTP